MSILAALWELGAQIRLAPNGQLVVAGLDRLPKHQAAKAVEVARSRKAEFLSELSAQIGLHRGAPILANVEAPASPSSSAASEQESWSCWCCGGRRYFLNTAGQPICARCHPPVDPIRFPVH